MGTAVGSAEFDAHLDDWSAYQRTPWGRLRYTVVAHTLDRLCGDRPALRVLDVGGGDGRDAVHLAGRGHAVTIIEPSGPLRDAADRAARAAGCDDLVTVVPGGIDDLRGSDHLDFDLVLCHNVLQYRADFKRSVGAVVGCAASQGVISLICPNPAADVLAGLVRGEDPAAALARLDAETGRSQTFDAEVARIPVDAAERALVGAGCELVDRFGIRCVTDFVVDDDRKDDPDYFAGLEALELALCDRDPYRQTARFWQLVGRAF